jgi:hypothetical protein
MTTVLRKYYIRPERRRRRGIAPVCLGAGLITRSARQNAELFAQTFCTFPREFSSFRRKGRPGRATLIPNTILPVYSGDRAIHFSGQSPPDARFPMIRKRSAIGDQAAASIDGHVAQAAERFASPRARRAVAARDIKSADTVSPVPNYISSGVRPRNAEWGSTRLCSST